VTGELPTLAWEPAVDPPPVSYETVEFDWLKRSVIEPARRSGAERTTLANPAQAWLDRLAGVDALAVRGVRLRTLDDLQALHSYVLEPAWRAGVRLLVECPERLTQLDREFFVDPGFEYPYTLERALHAATQLWRGAREEGTVQVIAPAGSGKTTALIERVAELLRRGVDGQRILATTFNRDARIELAERLGAVGVRSVEARTFHSLGLWLLRSERMTRPGGVRQLSLNQWKRLCALGSRDTGTWVEAADARAAISEIKLGRLETAGEFRPHANELTDGETIARIYALYEAQQSEQGVNDFDDMVMLAVRALRADPGLRARWQGRFSHVLVDEYQDIEPAQELLVRILAAPEDALFCVGDEDQTLYGWRRASVRRMIELDLAYPGLRRVSLVHNYRCPPEIVAASARLVGHNAIRFPKRIEPAPGRASAPGAIELHQPPTQAAGAARVATALRASSRGEIVVLARTTNLLRTVALACADRGVRISAPEAVFEPRGARLALEAYLRLCGAPSQARPEDVATVCRAPNRGLPYQAEEEVASLLRDRFSFSESFEALEIDHRQRLRLATAGGVLDALATLTDARRFIAYLRSTGGLDAYFEEHEEAFGETERIELEALEQAQAEAAGKTVAAYSAELEARTDALRAIRDDEHGIELTTIHRAKGRQWPVVQLFACEEHQLPHHRALEVTDTERAAGEGLEAERRLAYVAFTRAQDALSITATGSAASRFLSEAGLSPAQPYQPPAERQPGRGGAPAHTHADPKVARALGEAERVGLSYAIRTAPDRQTALELAATAIERRLVGDRTTSQRMTVTKLFAAVEQLSEAERTDALAAARVRNDQTLVGRLDLGGQRLLIKTLRALALQRVGA
jgi:DNA helicase-2/ATP-dependent DNA helicase PcrA